ncbi:uncharacterized protein BDV14DRAFT_185529 [Aspergillus stella-maris]|uniref:uncharacterized protein n=1 Tax=Aspergillus stella-maris TaxID=1810926 RepID=UPI003CCDCB38
MCFGSDDSDVETRSVRVFDHHHHHSHPHDHHHHHHSHRIPFPPRFRRSVYPPPHHLPPLHYPHHHHHHRPHPSRIEDTTIIYNPRRSPDCSPPPSPQPSYTTMSRRYVRTRRESIEPVSFGFGRSIWGRDRDCEAPRYIQYVEREPERRCEGRDVEYIPCR